MKKCPQCKKEWGDEVLHCPACSGYVVVEKK